MATGTSNPYAMTQKRPVLEQLRQLNRLELLDLVKMHLSFLIDVTADEWKNIISPVEEETQNKLNGQQQCAITSIANSGASKSSNSIMSSKNHSPANSLATTTSNASHKMFSHVAQHQQQTNKEEKMITRKEMASNIFGAPLTVESLKQISLLIDFLNKSENYKLEGIFRKSGNSARQQELRYLLNCGVQVDLEANRFTPNDCSCVLKAYIQELTQPLLTNNHFEIHYELAAHIKRETASDQLEQRNKKRLKIIQLLLHLIPDLNRQFFQSLMALLHKVALEKEKTKMDELSLATIFGSHILCPRTLPPKQIQERIELITNAMEFMLLNYKDLFNGPTELIMDARNKLTTLEQQYKQQQLKQQLSKLTTPSGKKSSSKKLTPSNTETTENNTIITFCQRSKDPVKETETTTATALAELYAQVQSMPDTPQKRKYIKQFNRQNGFGTPMTIKPRDKAAKQSKWKALIPWKSSSHESSTKFI